MKRAFVVLVLLVLIACAYSQTPTRRGLLSKTVAEKDPSKQKIISGGEVIETFTFPEREISPLEYMDWHSALSFRELSIKRMSLKPVVLSGTYAKEWNSQAGVVHYLLFVPPKPQYILVLFHGGATTSLKAKKLFESWLDIARQQGIIVVAPQAQGGVSPAQPWNSAVEDKKYLQGLVEEVSKLASLPADTKIYLGGHSSGANHALLLTFLAQDIVSAVAVHAGTLPPGAVGRTKLKKRIGVYIQVGDRDTRYSVASVRRTVGELGALVGTNNVRLGIIPGHTHLDIYNQTKAQEINTRAWHFLSRY